jgi:hypothetical protein
MASSLCRKTSVKPDFISGRRSRHPPTITVHIRGRSAGRIQDARVQGGHWNRHFGTFIDISSFSGRVFSSISAHTFLN